MELFDKKFVHFIWDEELKGKRGFLSSGIDALIKMVNEDSDRTEIQKGCERDLPFCKHITVECRLAYYDPNYEVKKAFNKGKRLQFRPKNEHLSWGDCVNPSWDVKLEYRVKPEEEIFITYLARPKHRDCYLTACAEGMWEAVQKEYDAKTKLFVGTWDEAVKWYESREKFTEVIKAWEDGKRIQVTPEGTDKWVELHCEPTWDVKLEYRVKPECPCEDGIDSKANEWHKVSDKLPEMDVLVYIWNNVDDFPVVARRHIPYGHKEWVWDCKWGSGFTVSQSKGKNYLWKGIVLPNLINDKEC